MYDETRVEDQYTLYGFPLSLISYLRCRVDGGELDPSDLSMASEGFIREGSLQCRKCSTRFLIAGGIVRMLDEQELDAESLHELHMRDDRNNEMPDFPDTPEVNYWNELEIEPTLKALNVDSDTTLLEIACGAGRYTMKLVSNCRAIVGVDFSLASLRALARNIPPQTSIGLVQADITRLQLAPRSFDRVLSTTCLDNRDQRMAMHRLAAESLNDKGRYVFGNEFYNLQTQLLGLPKVMRYTPQGMVFCHLEKNDIRRETAPYFGRVRTRTVQIPLPFTSALPFSVRKIISRIAERTPVLRHLGVLLLVQAEAPLRMPEEGETTAGNRLAKAVYNWYKNRRVSTTSQAL
jgi:SAM-dependent methyltransferase